MQAATFPIQWAAEEISFRSIRAAEFCPLRSVINVRDDDDSYNFQKRRRVTDSSGKKKKMASVGLNPLIGDARLFVSSVTCLLRMSSFQ